MWLSWAGIVMVLLVGYLSMSRSFAYVGYPPANVFIGEVVLATALIARPEIVLKRFGSALVRPSPLSGVAWGVYLFVGYGMVQALAGIYFGRPPLATLQNFAFNYYALYLFLGVWVGRRWPSFLPRLAWCLGWFNGLYGGAYVLYLNRVSWTIPGTPDVDFFGQPAGSAVALLALLAYHRHRMLAWPLIAANAFVLLNLQVRAEWLGFVAGSVVLAICSKQFGRLIVGTALVGTVLGCLYAADVRFPAVAGRGGEVGVREMIGRALAPLNEDLAAEYTPDAATYAGTASWRTTWWDAIWETVHEDQVTELVGLGYGFPLKSLVPYLAGEELRTPHNVFFYALGYSGWMGVAAFTMFQLMLVSLLWRTVRHSGDGFGLAYWTTAVTGAFFSNFFETPFGAIPFYLLVGLAGSAALSTRRVRHARLARPQLLPAAGWRRSGVFR